MPKYLVVRRSEPESPGKGESPSPEQMQEMYAKFTEWQQKFPNNIVDMGGKLNGRAKVIRIDREIDGPFVEAKEIIGGFMILSAENIDEAIRIARLCPGVMMPGVSLEVREFNTP